jgi:glutathione S-transferase
MAVHLYGPVYSTYTRAARLALAEKGVAYDLHSIDLLKGEGQAPPHRDRHPWGKAPAFEHDGFRLFETIAINRYIDEAFAGPALQPDSAKGRARMTQIVSVVDNYAYDAIVMRYLWNVMFLPMMGNEPDMKVAGDALPVIDHCLGAIDALGDGGRFLVGDSISLADLHFIPMMDYFSRSEAGPGALKKRTRLARWWDELKERESVVSTRP